MTKLLRTNFFKIFHSWSFWLMALILPFINIFTIINNDREYLGQINDSGIDRWNLMQCSESCFDHMSYINFFVLILAGILIGDEFSSGTIRNKINAGFSRVQIYLTYSIAAVVESLMIHLICVLTAYTVCTIRYGYDGCVNMLFNLITNSIAPVAALALMTVFFIIAASDCIIGMAAMLVTDIAVNYIAVGYMTDKLRFSPETVSQSERNLFLIIDSLIPGSYSDWFAIFRKKSALMGTTVIPSCGWCYITAIVFLISGLILFNKKDMK